MAPLTNEPLTGMSKSTRIKRLGLSLFLTSGYGTASLLVLVPAAFPLGLAFVPYLLPIVWLTFVIVVTRFIYRQIAKNGAQRAIIAAEVLTLLLLPVIGTVFNGLLDATCIETDCDTSAMHRPFALPQFFHVWVLHLLTVLAYAIARRRGGSLPPRTEVMVLGGLFVGCVLQIALCIQLGLWVVYGILGAPLILCAASPLFALLFFAHQIRTRMARLVQLKSSVPGALGVGAGLLGLYALIEAAFGKHTGAVFDVFTRTCGNTFSQLPIIHQPCTGHYLCTVAACGHPRLVKPLRLGLRGGATILVNRQLAIANAFEDLLHERFPRVGSVARRVYDKLGLPVARWVRHRLLADIVYVLMKPAELAFYTFLLLLDPSDPEERLARMYLWSQNEATSSN